MNDETIAKALFLLIEIELDSYGTGSPVDERIKGSYYRRLMMLKGNLDEKDSGRRFKVETVDVLSDENDFKGEEWHAVTEEGKVEHTFLVRNEDVANRLCDFMNGLDMKAKEAIESLLESEIQRKALLALFEVLE